MSSIRIQTGISHRVKRPRLVKQSDVTTVWADCWNLYNHVSKWVL